jgi:hypothetical protein
MLRFSVFVRKFHLRDSALVSIIVVTLKMEAVDSSEILISELSKHTASRATSNRCKKHISRHCSCWTGWWGEYLYLPRGEVTWGWWKLNKEEPRNFCSSPNVAGESTWRRMRLECAWRHMSDYKCAKNLRLKSYVLRLEISTLRWKDNIKIYVARNRMGECGLDFLTRDTDWLGAFVIRINRLVIF